MRYTMQNPRQRVSRIVLKAELTSTWLSFFDNEGKEVYGNYPHTLTKHFCGNDKALEYIKTNFPDAELQTNLKKIHDPGKPILDVTRVSVSYCEGQYSAHAYTGDSLYSRNSFYACDYTRADIFGWLKSRYPNAKIVEKSVTPVKLWGKSSFFDHA